MHPRLAPRYRDLERRSDALLESISSLTPEQRSFRPGPDAWSAVQVADHLARTERSVLDGLQRGLPEHLRRRKLRHVLAYPMVLAVMRVPVKVKAPLREIVPREVRPFDVVREEWAAARRGLRKHLEGLADDEVSAPLIRHPVAGPAGADKLLTFLAAHVRHHEFQLGRLVRHRGFPARHEPG